MSLNFDKKSLLESQSFCMLPWIHMHVWPNGNVFPCCVADTNYSFGDLNNNSLKEVWNSDKFKELRTRMLSGKKSAECERCYNVEAIGGTSMRVGMNLSKSEAHFDKVLQTNVDGSLPSIQLPYFDMRLSNLCNFRCRTCGPYLSSSWYEDETKAYGKPHHPKVMDISEKPGFWEELEPILDTVEEVYFAGGEPLFSEWHYKILEYWEKKQMFDVKITYTTNFSRLEYAGRKVTDLWKKWKHVDVYASLDASGERAEYMRKGTRWDSIVENRKTLLRECPHVNFYLTPTISIFNVFHFPNFHKEWVDLGLVEPNNIRLNVLSFPETQSINMLPINITRELMDFYELRRSELFKYAEQKGQEKLNIYTGYGSVKTALCDSSKWEKAWDFFEIAFHMDRIRGENLLQVFPELKPFYEWAERDIKTRKYGHANTTP